MDSLPFPEGESMQRVCVRTSPNPYNEQYTTKHKTPGG